MDQYIGKWLDNRYELLERIGTGGMAVVYKARDHRLNRLVAVKILKPELAGDAEFRRRFQDESRAVAMLSHPNIMAVYDVSQSDNLNYIVMELIDGITLKQYMQRRGTPLNWREALHFITQIMKALSHAHGRGVIHRDIKPHNVMVLRDGSVKVADFGIARLLGGDGQNTLTQEALGSVHYISPEQAKGSHVDGRSDIYSAGVVLYEMVTGRLPYEGDSAVAVAIQHINSAPIPPRELNPDLPEALQEITLKAMDPEINRRYASADEMLADLEEFRKNPSISFDYTPLELREEESASEPTRVVPAARVRAEEDSARRRAMTEDSARRRAVSEDSARRRAVSEDSARRRAVQPSRRQEEDEDDYYDPPRRGFPVGGLVSVLIIGLFIAGMVWFLWTSFIGPLLLPSDTFEVPELTGMTMEEIYADSSITDVWSINLSSEYVASDQYEYGQVAQQEPKAKTVVKENNLNITVFLSSGPDEDGDAVRMPALAGKEIRAARDELEDLDLSLQIKIDEQESDSITEDYVISSDPEMGTPLEMGQLVTIVVSSGPKEIPATVPNLMNMSLEDASNAITAAKLVLQDIRDGYSDTVPEGLVMFQSIAPTEEVRQGTGIIIQISKGPSQPSYTYSPNPWDTPSQDPIISPPVVTPSQDPIITPPVVTPDPSTEPSTEPSPEPSQPESPPPEQPTDPAVEAGGETDE